MDVFKKCYEYTRAEDAKKMGLYPYFTEIEKVEGNFVWVKGKKILMVGSNNYLGLFDDARCKRGDAKNRCVIVGDMLHQVIFGQVGEAFAFDLRTGIEDFAHSLADRHLNHHASTHVAVFLLCCVFRLHCPRCYRNCQPNWKASYHDCGRVFSN